jgi:hypothetical protein
MYSKHDVIDVLDGLKKVVRVSGRLLTCSQHNMLTSCTDQFEHRAGAQQENFRHELSKDVNMTVLILKQLFEEADRQVRAREKARFETALLRYSVDRARRWRWTCRASRTRVSEEGKWQTHSECCVRGYLD